MTALGVTLELDIADVEELLRREVARRYRGLTLTGFTIRSHNTVLAQVYDGTMTEPVRHHLRPDHRQLDWS